ncbi:MAG: hypothetical protein CVV33_08530, partial [Methanomicrobiales archaeon HGW-Methanomicrobiales-4]
MVINRFNVKIRVIFVLILALALSVLLAGCIAQSGDNNTSHPTGTSIPASHLDSEKPKEVLKESGLNKSSAGDSYYNIRIVPASVLDTMQKEMGPDEYLVHNEKGYPIGIVSSEG